MTKWIVMVTSLLFLVNHTLRGVMSYDEYIQWKHRIAFGAIKRFGDQTPSEQRTARITHKSYHFVLALLWAYVIITFYLAR